MKLTLYPILKIITRYSLRTFYKVQVRNLNKSPKGRAIMEANNHLNAFMDSLLIQIEQPRKVFTLPRGDIFVNASPLALWFYEEFRLIPIFRRMDGVENMDKNDDTFQRCYSLLNEKQIIQIFPEAICIQERRLKSMKKGVGRIMLRAEEEYDYKIDTALIIGGLNYERPYKFNSRMFINYSRPYEITDFIEIYKENKVHGINALTKFIGDKIRSHVVHIDKPELDELVEQLELIFTPHLMDEYGMTKGNHAHRFLISREIADGVNYFESTDPELIGRLKKETSLYIQEVNAAGIQDGYLYKQPKIGQLLVDYFIVLFGFPLQVVSMALNFIPIWISKSIAKKVVKRVEYFASVRILSGMILFVLFYIIYIIFFSLYFNSLLVGITVWLSALALRRFSIYYDNIILELKNIQKFFIVKNNHGKKLDDLKENRQIIIHKLVDLKSRYRQRHIR